MSTNDLITLLEREAQRLSDENDHSAAILIRAAITELRRLTAAKTQ